MLDKDKIARKYLPLIRWASRRASAKYSNSQFDYSDFFDGGLEALSICLAKHDDLPEDEFAKYFKTSLFHKLRQIQLKAFSKKYYGLKVSFDSLVNVAWEGKSPSLVDLPITNSLDSYISNNKSFKSLVKHALIKDGVIVDWKFEEVELKKEQACQNGKNDFENVRNFLEDDIDYKNLIKSIKFFLFPLERKIFELYVEPPDDFLDMLLNENSRKIKYMICTNITKKGTHKVVIKTDHIFSYLEKDGITKNELSKSLQSMKKKVEYYLKYGIERIPKNYDAEYGKF